jgi:hypothetical protein
MMKARSFLISFVSGMLVLTTALPVHGQGGIIVTGADTTRQMDASLNPGLSAVAGSVRPRVVMENAYTQRQEPLVVPSNALQGLFSQVPVRVTFQFANTSRYNDLTSPPGALQALFSAVRPRVVFDAANSNRSATLSYPVALIGDSTPPQINAIAGSRQGNTAIISWTTDEFATSEVRWGAASGAYTRMASDPLFEKTHSLTLTGLTAGRPYYFVVHGADRSGNQAQSGEYQVKVQTKTYLPMVLRGR